MEERKQEDRAAAELGSGVAADLVSRLTAGQELGGKLPSVQKTRGAGSAALLEQEGSQAQPPPQHPNLRRQRVAVCRAGRDLRKLKMKTSSRESDLAQHLVSAAGRHGRRTAAPEGPLRPRRSRRKIRSASALPAPKTAWSGSGAGGQIDAVETRGRAGPGAPPAAGSRLISAIPPPLDHGFSPVAAACASRESGRYAALALAAPRFVERRRPPRGWRPGGETEVKSRSVIQATQCEKGIRSARRQTPPSAPRTFPQASHSN